MPPPKKATYGHQIDKGMIKLPRRKEYNNSGKSVLLHVGIDKEKEYILNWMRTNFDNVSENVWIILAKHIEEVEASRASYALTKKGKRMTAQDKFFALVEKWGTQ